MSLSDFDDGYYYATELKSFAGSLGVAGAYKLRKDQLESLIRNFLRTGKIPTRPSSSESPPTGTEKDSSRRLTLSTPIRRYTNDPATKEFLFRQARLANPHFKQKSGAMYWINRWREDQIASGAPITYGDLVRKFVELNATTGPLPRIPSTKFNNFVSDFLAHESNATRARALAAWEELKQIRTPKTYACWRRFHHSETPKPTSVSDTIQPGHQVT